jgi:hypothetical protein
MRAKKTLPFPNWNFAFSGATCWRETFSVTEEVLVAKVTTTRVLPSPNDSPTRECVAFASFRNDPPDSTVKTNPPPNASQAATAELEVDVLNLLNQAKADLGEQITVTGKTVC